MNGIQGPVHLHSNSIADFVEFVDELNTVGHTYTLTASTLVRTGMAPVTFDPMGQVILAAPSGASTGSTVNVQAVGASTFAEIALGTNDTLTVGSRAPTLGGTLAAILGPLSAQQETASAGSVILDDSGDMNPEQATLAPDGTSTYKITNLTPSPIYLKGIGKATLDAGKGTNTFAVQGLPVSTALTVNGGTGSNTLTGPNQAATWTINGANSGSLGKLKFTHIQNLVGGSAGDVFKFGAAGSLSGSLNGGGGGDWLDYSAFASTSPVSVNLVTGAATRVAGGVSNIANVRGGAGNDALTGNGGNILIGGAGTNELADDYSGSAASERSLLIGGTGNSNLTAGAAGDILIAGITNFDMNNAALAAILVEWQSSDTYQERFDSLQGLKGSGTGSHLNGTYDLIWGKTVTDRDAASVLTGGSAGLDWFFANYPSGNDTINNIDAPGDEYLNNGI